MATATFASTSSAATDEAALSRLFQNMLDAWTRGDGTAYAALFTENADYIGFEGVRSEGRDTIAAWHQYLFDNWLKGSRLQGKIERIRLLSPTVALMYTTGGIALGTQVQYRRGRHSIQTLVAVKEQDTWRFTAFHNSRVQHRNQIANVLFGLATRVFGR